MKEYIERAAVEKFIEDGLNNLDKNKAFGHDAIEIMAEVHYMPAADVVEVVRCRECVNTTLTKNCPGVLFCLYSQNPTPPDGFCYRGKRLEADHD